MKTISVQSLRLEPVKVIRYPRFRDARGYFTEHYRRSDFCGAPELDFLRNVTFVQCNESFSRAGVVRGLHFQWNPCQGKLVRTVMGRMVDMVVDIRKGSPSFGRIVCHDMPAEHGADYAEWIWVPPGFAHGAFFLAETVMEYFCTGEYSPCCEAGLSPLAEDLDWSLCAPALKDLFKGLANGAPLLSEKDRAGHSLQSWQRDPRSDHFVFGPP